MTIKAIEVKRGYDLEKDEKEYIFESTCISQILTYECLFTEEILREYIKNNPVPKDKYFNIEYFIRDLDSESYICVCVEKEETIDYLCSLLYTLV